MLVSQRAIGQPSMDLDHIMGFARPEIMGIERPQFERGLVGVVSPDEYQIQDSSRRRVSNPGIYGKDDPSVGESPFSYLHEGEEDSGYGNKEATYENKQITMPDGRNYTLKLVDSNIQTTYKNRLEKEKGEDKSYVQKPKDEYQSKGKVEPSDEYKPKTDGPEGDYALSAEEVIDMIKGSNVPNKGIGARKKKTAYKSKNYVDQDYKTPDYKLETDGLFSPDSEDKDEGKEISNRFDRMDPGVGPLRLQSFYSNKNLPADTMADSAPGSEGKHSDNNDQYDRNLPNWILEGMKRRIDNLDPIEYLHNEKKNEDYSNSLNEEGPTPELSMNITPVGIVISNEAAMTSPTVQDGMKMKLFSLQGYSGYAKQNCGGCGR
tara:strand:- start:197 stop:1324 length:1128 start_codon:yes stop_codon:yes gene_type:complete